MVAFICQCGDEKELYSTDVLAVGTPLLKRVGDWPQVRTTKAALFALKPPFPSHFILPARDYRVRCEARPPSRGSEVWLETGAAGQALPCSYPRLDQVYKKHMWAHGLGMGWCDWFHSTSISTLTGTIQVCPSFCFLLFTCVWKRYFHKFMSEDVCVLIDNHKCSCFVYIFVFFSTVCTFKTQ